MREYRVVNIEGTEYKVNDKGGIIHPTLPDRFLRSDANAYEEVHNRLEKGEYHVAKVKDWEDYGNPIQLSDSEVATLKEMLIEKMTTNQKRFVEEFILGEHAGNQARAYARAYGREEDLANGDVALSTLSGNANYQLKLPYIKKYQKIILKEAGYDAESIDVRLNQLAWQDEDKRVAIQAIKEINKLHGRIIDRMEVSGNIQHNHSPMDLSKLSDGELDQLYDIVKKLKEDNDNEIEVIED